MSEGVLLWQAGGVKLYAYGLILALAALAGSAALWLCFQRAYKPGERPSALGVSMAALAGALVGARAVYCAAMLPSFLADVGPAQMLALWRGGYALPGAVAGGALGAACYARARRVKAGALLDACAPAALCVLALARLGEATTDQGLGDYVLSEGRQFFPLAVENLYGGEYQIPVFFYEALAALAIGLWAWTRLGRGGAAVAALCWLCAAQLPLESLREDDFIRFGFVRFNQLCAAAALAAALACRLRRMRAKGGALWGRAALFLACLLVNIGVEFALDKTAISVWALYAAMCAASACMALLATGAGARQGATASHA